VSTKHSQQAPSDLELMLYADDELPPDEARSVAAWIASHPDARAKVEAIRQMGEVVRTYVELEADQAEPRLEDAWSAIARKIHTNGRVVAEEGDDEVPATRRQKTLPRPEPQEGLWASIRGWFGEHRGHVITGVVTAGAVAVLMFFMGPREQVTERTVRSTTVGAGTPAALESQPPEVEDLEVYEGSGTILTIEPEGDDDSGAAVIWISNDEDEITEDPI
jgi:anti-sigma factor RsiW